MLSPCCTPPIPLSSSARLLALPIYMRRASASPPVLLAHHDCQPSHPNSKLLLSSRFSRQREHRKLAALPARKTPPPNSQQRYRYGMELELGLAPPSTRHPNSMAIEHGHGHLAAADELSSTSSDHHRHPCAAPARAGKRAFAEAFQEAEAEAEATTTLPLFDDGSLCGGRNGGSKKPLVGWPPVSSARSRACSAKYVKVNKEGDAIGRKVDLSLHDSYGELLTTLARMFPTNSNQDDKEISSSTSSTTTRHVDVVVTYEDGEGDWMLVGDVPWDDFARSVKRLKILG